MDVIVVGGGASGLVAAINARRRGANVVVLERNNVCGKKILVTGNGKCNYYNSDQKICHYHSGSSNNVDKIINDNNNNLLLDFLDSIGLVPYIKDGYYYPHSKQAVTVLNALLNECNILGVIIKNNCFVKDIIKLDNKFIIKADNGEYSADKVIISTGSYSYYKNMIINSYEIASRLGHKIIKPLPALVQLKSSDKIVKKWAGVRCNVIIKLYQDDSFIRQEEGEVTLTDYGISGICAMQLSSDVARMIDKGKKCYVYINFVYDIAMNSNKLLDFINNYNKQVKNRSVSYILDSLLNYKLVNAMLDKVGIDKDSNWDDINDDKKDKLVRSLTSFKIKIDGTKSFEYSQTTSGGVNIDEVNLETMESLLVKNLYFTGEILDINGDCGGYNLTFAFTSGMVAGSSCGSDNND